MKIGLGLCTFNRPGFCKQSLNSLIKNNFGGATDLYMIDDCSYEKYSDEYKEIFQLAEENNVTVIKNKVNKGVGISKNILMRNMLNDGCDHIFLMEDDILMKKNNVCLQYISAAKAYEVHHMNFALHGTMNVGRASMYNGMTVYPNIVGAFSYYTKEVLEKVGLMDENFKNAWEHCFGHETKILTSEGWKEIGLLNGKTVNLMTKEGKWVNAPISSFGKQQLNKITLKKKTKVLTIRATENHEWIKPSGEKITKLKVGDKLKEVYGRKTENFFVNPLGVQWGLVTGDGYVDRKYSCVNLYEHKAVHSSYYQGFKQHKCHNNGIKVSGLPLFFKKTLPSINESRQLLFGWLAGYFAADGHISKEGVCSISSKKKYELEYVKDVCGKLGIETNSIKQCTQTDGYEGGLVNPTYYIIVINRNHLISDFFLNKHHKERFLLNKDKHQENAKWTIINIEEDNEEEVFCATVKDTHSFVIEGNILTGNCEHTYVIAEIGMTTPFWKFVDHPNSTDLLEEIPGSIDNSSIRPLDDWQSNISEGQKYWINKHGKWLPPRE